MPLAKDGVFLISRPAEWTAVSSATAIDILTALQHRGASSVADIADAIGRRPTALYHHLARFEKLGLVTAVGQSRSASGPPKVLYELSANQVSADFDAKTGRNVAQAKRLFVLALRAMERLLARSFDARLIDLDPDRRPVDDWTVTVHRGRLDEAAIAEIRELAHQINAIVARSRNARVGRHWAVMTMSVPVAEKETSRKPSRRQARAQPPRARKQE
ncbi:MAG: winged helix-turn-helix transcriptional regulator [Phycisphaerales bacterium]|nr:winged helix-turn-helix transcriptional regulator [Phycisphaerales bacterium]